MMKRALVGAALILSLINGGEAAAYELYIGDFHSHTTFSDGLGMPDDAFDMARNQGHTDFWTVSDHYEQFDMVEGLPEGSPKVKEWDYLKEHAAKKTEDGKFIAFAAYEWFDQPQGHINVLNATDIPKFGQAYNMKLFFKWVVKHPNVLMGFNHPADSAKDGAITFNHLEYVPEVASQTFYMAVNVDEDIPYYYQALDKGWRVGPSGQQDNHKMTWGMLDTFTCVYADSLTNNSLVEAFRQRRIYAVNNRNIKLWLEGNGAPMGSEIEAGSVDFLINASITGGGKIASVTLVTNGGAVVKEWKPGADKADLKFTRTVDFNDKRWFAAVVRDANNKYAVSAPVWVSPKK